MKSIISVEPFSCAKKILSDNADSLKVNSRSRVCGVKVKSKDEIFKVILSILKSRPMTPTHLAYVIGKTREHTSRQFLKPLLEQKKIEKIQGTNIYQLVGQNATAQQIAIDDVNDSTFGQSIFVQNWLKHASTTKYESRAINNFENLCLGRFTPDFKIHPDNWRHPETTEKVIMVLRKHYGKIRINATMRGIIRRFLKYGMKLQISESDGVTLGIDGAKDNIGAHSSATFESGQYDAGKTWSLKHYGLVFHLKFGVKFWTFVRPSILYTIRLDQIIFYNREIEYLNLDGEKIVLSVTVDKEKTITNRAQYQMALDANSEKYKILKYTDRACHIKDVREFKTGTDYPKYIYDNELVKRLESYVTDRIKKGFKYLFWDDNSTVFTSENYNKIVATVRQTDNWKLKRTFAGIHCKDSIFVTDSNYAMRHVGSQHWLDITDYDYAFIAEMGWEDINTLRIWYGKRIRKSFERKIARFF